MIYTPYGSQATERLGERIAVQKDGDPLAPVTVLVPTNIAGLAVRRALGARGDGIAAVEFRKLFDLAERLAGPKMAIEQKRKPLSGPVLSATVRSVLNTDPGLFHASAHHPATEQALVRSYRDLRELTAEQLKALASQSDRAADVVRICREVGDKLKSQWYDGHDLSELAISALATGSLSDVLQSFGPVIIHLPQRVTRSQGLLVAALSQATPVSVIAGITGNERADGAVVESIGRMGARLSPVPEISPPHGERVISTASADEEIRVAVREVVNAAREGIPLSRIAVLCGGGRNVIRQLQDQLDAAGIAYNGPSGRTLADSLVGRGLIAMLNLDGRDFRRDEVFALLSVASAPVSSNEGPNEQPALAADMVMAWERVSRRAGVARGAEQWETRLNRFAEEQRKAAQDEPADSDRAEGLKERRLREAEHAESLAEFMGQLVGQLTPEPAPATWKDWCGWVRGLIHTYLGDEVVRQSWPALEQKAASEIEEILDRLANLDKIETAPRSATFRHTLISELGAPTGRVGKVGHGVHTEAIGASLGMELDKAIVIGMAEGTFPHSPSDDPLLPDRERKASGDDLALLSDRIDEQHRHLLAVLASTKTATLIYSRGDARRVCEQHPSRWLLDTATALAGRTVDSTNLESVDENESVGWFEHVPSMSGRVLHTDYPATGQEFWLRALAQVNQSGNELPFDDPVLARGAELVTARASEQFTRFDGNLVEVDTTGLVGNVVSPTSLETWADCPMRYLFRHVLRILPVDQPEEIIEISALDKGTLVHSALDRFMEEQLESAQVPPPGQPWSKLQRERLLEIGTEMCEQAEAQGLTGAPVYWRHHRDRILSDLDRFLDEDDEQRQENAVTPAASELAFGMSDDEFEEVAVSLPNGRTVRFRGQIDRVDQGANGTLLVTDYKTGNAEDFKKLNKDKQGDDWDPVQRGTKLQLPVYGLAARALTGSTDAQLSAQYWFVTSDENFKTLGYGLNDEVMDRFSEVLGTIADGIDAGLFCDRPKPDKTTGQFSQPCEYCNSDRLGTQDRRRSWERIQDQVELTDYRKLAEPPTEVDLEGIDNGADQE